MSETELVQVETRDGVRWLWLNRPSLGNAFDDRVIKQLSDELTQATKANDVRVIVLAGRGKHFSAGADFNWMQRMVDLSFEENVEDALQLARLMRQIHDCPKPTIAAVNGAAYGGALGLICACDLAYAASSATFSLSEVKLGLIPAVISPYVISAMGRRQAMRWMLTAEVFNATTAGELNVVHELVDGKALISHVQHVATALNRNGPRALGEVKRLIRDIAGRRIDDEIAELTAERIARIRVSPEGQEGLRAFLEKRDPVWRLKD
ncbi:MAG: enoyl-CoA hydratase/isomerase family protein [Pseudomonadota bacterium]